MSGPIADVTVTTLGEVVRRTRGTLQTGPFGSQLHASDYTRFGTPLVMPINLGDNEIRESGIARIGPKDTRRLRRHALREGDIVFSRRGDVGRRSIVRTSQAGWLCGTGCLAARFGSNLSTVNPAYVAQYLGSNPAQTWLQNNAVGGTMPNLNTSILAALPIRLPPRAVQDAIVASLDDARATVVRIEVLIAKKERIKQGMMEQLLGGRTRLPAFAKPWTEVTIGDLATVVSGGTPRSSVAAYWDGSIPWCTPTDITSEKNRTLTITERTISQAGLDHSAAQLLPSGSILLCTRATIGEVKIAMTPIATNQGFKSLVPRPAVSSEFLYYKLLTLKDDLASRGSGSTFLEVSKRDVEGFRLMVPDTNEQQAIASALGDIDDELAGLRRRLSKSRNIKQGMMQELLTGRIRLPVPESLT
jgi:type I restriction enzyme S subunit